MRQLCVRAIVDRPVAAARKALREYVQRHCRPDGSVALSLRVPLFPSFTTRLALIHDVPVSFWQGREEDNLDDVLLIEWTPKGWSPYPAFSGTVHVYPEADPQSARLEIDGAYEPPGGLAGRAFDALIGARMALVSLTDLVERLAKDVTTRRAPSAP
jgi:hypothetical protein